MLSNIEDEIELVERHIRVLKYVIENEPIGIIKLSMISGIPQHKIRYSLRILEQGGIIKPSPQGAITTKKAKGFLKTFPERLDSMIEKMNKTRELFKSK